MKRLCAEEIEKVIGGLVYTGSSRWVATLPDTGRLPVGTVPVGVTEPICPVLVPGELA